MEALTPEEIRERQKKQIPGVVINEVNKMLTKKGYLDVITILEKELVSNIVKNSSYEKEEIYENDWLKFKPIFEEKGWKVNYTLDHSYNPCWEFEEDI